VAKAVKARMVEMTPVIGQGFQPSLIIDNSKVIEENTHEVWVALLFGGLMAILIILLFLLDVRGTAISALALPTSVMGTFFVMYLLGYTLNQMTLISLSLAIGLLIDDAVVVREAITHRLEEGEAPMDAAANGTRDVYLAVLATTLSLVAVFIPVAFMPGIVGQFFKQFGVTMSVAVVISLFISFTLDPMLSSVWNDPDAHGARGNGPVARLLRGFERLMRRLEDGYVAVLRWGLAHRWTTVAGAVLTLVVALGLARSVGSEFVPQPDNNEMYLQFYTPVGSSLELTADKTRQVESALREFPEVVFTYATVNTGAVQGKNYATVFLRLKDRTQRAMSVKQLVAPVRARLDRIAGITITNLGVFSTFGNKQIEVSVQGADQKQIEALAARAVDAIRRIPGVVDLDTSSKPAKPTVAVEVDRAVASDLGIGVAQVGAALRPLLAGEVATTWKAPDDENYDVRIRLPMEGRRDIEDLARLTVASAQLDADGAPRPVPLRQVAKLVPTEGPTQINRKNLTREVLITANVYGAPPGTVGLEIQRQLKEIPVPPGYAFVTGGATKDMQESFGYALQALLLAVVFIYMILASQFRSFIQPVSIMASLPLSLIGVMVALLAWRSTLNMFSVIGFIMLMGLVTKNAILLIDFANQQRRDGVERGRALLAAAEIRLRPILMTTLAMVFGMLPLAVSTSEGAEQRAPMAHAVIGGVIASTLLTLLVVPVLYALLDDLAQALARRRRPAGEPVESAPPV
jgi:HAE1 family hydrophobic/amphiphilic exporter-1